MSKWYLSHGLNMTAIHKYLKYGFGSHFHWFPKDVRSTRRNGDNDPSLKQLVDTKNLILQEDDSISSEASNDDIYK